MKNFMMACLLLITGVSVYAQKPGGTSPAPKTPEQRATAVTNRLEKKLSLSKDQKTKVHDLAMARAQKMDELRAKYKDQDKKLWQAERKKLRDEFHAGMKATLSPEQYAKWEAQRKKQIEKRKGKNKPAAKGGKGTKGDKGAKGGNDPAKPDAKPDDSEVGDDDEVELDGESK